MFVRAIRYLAVDYAGPFQEKLDCWRVWNVQLSINQIYGTMSYEVGSLTLLEKMSLRDNQIIGTISLGDHSSKESSNAHVKPQPHLRDSTTRVLFHGIHETLRSSKQHFRWTVGLPKWVNDPVGSLECEREWTYWASRFGVGKTAKPALVEFEYLELTWFASKFGCTWHEGQLTHRPLANGILFTYRFFRFDLSSNPLLSGSLPSEICHLSYLNFVNLMWTELTGISPSTWCNITNLLYDRSAILCRCDCPCSWERFTPLRTGNYCIIGAPTEAYVWLYSYEMHHYYRML